MLFKRVLERKGYEIKAIKNARYLRQLARITFIETYGAHVIEKGDVHELEQEMDELYSLDRIKGWLTQPQYTCLGLYQKHTQDLVGYCVLELKGSVAFLDKLYLHSSVQNQRLGRFLMQACLAKLRANQQITTLKLDVWDKNSNAIRFYKSLGFTSTGEKKPYTYSNGAEPDFDEVYSRGRNPEPQLILTEEQKRLA